MSIIDKIEGMSRDELVQLAATQGLKVHYRAKDSTIRQAIIDHVAAPKVAPELKHPAEAPVKTTFHNTPEEVDAMLASIKAKVPQFTAEYDLKKNTWWFKCKGAEDCGNLDIPMRVIAMKARTVSRGRIALLGMNDHFDKTTATGKSAYTNTVLSA